MMESNPERYHSDKAGIYIHVPFCIRKCNYCAFLSQPAGEAAREAYVQALIREIELRSNEIHEIDTVFFGGGTPSLLSAEQIARIVRQAKKYFDFAEYTEITMEANPATLTFESLRGYRKAGVNRLSMGVQSFHDDRLRMLGRIHTAEDARREFQLARDAGFDNINIDLMFGIPGSTLEEVLEDVTAVCELKPEHVSFYSLQLEEGTTFFRQFEAGELREVPDEIDREMYHRGIELLASRGYQHYEISNFGMEGFWSRHNYKYWSMNEYLGLGLGASSYVQGRRIVNVSDMAEYLRAVETGGNLHEEVYENTSEDDMSEAVFTGLRRAEGIRFDDVAGSQDAFYEKYSDAMRELEAFAQNGYIEIDDTGMRLTEKGIDVSNRIMALFV